MISPDFFSAFILKGFLNILSDIMISDCVNCAEESAVGAPCSARLTTAQAQ